MADAATVERIVKHGSRFVLDADLRPDWYVFSILHGVGPQRTEAEREGLLRERGLPTDPEKRQKRIAQIERRLLAAARAYEGGREVCLEETP